MRNLNVTAYGGAPVVAPTPGQSPRQAEAAFASPAAASRSPGRAGRDDVQAPAAPRTAARKMTCAESRNFEAAGTTLPLSRSVWRGLQVMDEIAATSMPARPERTPGQRRPASPGPRALSQYADDLVVVCRTAQKCRANQGHPERASRSSYTRRRRGRVELYDGKKGFDFSAATCTNG